jgi:hypothetical protein
MLFAGNNLGGRSSPPRPSKRQWALTCSAALGKLGRGFIALEQSSGGCLPLRISPPVLTTP